MTYELSLRGKLWISRKRLLTTDRLNILITPKGSLGRNIKEEDFRSLKTCLATRMDKIK